VVLDRVRQRLAADPARADVQAMDLAGWGPAAVPAVPELVAALPQAPASVTWALLQLQHDEPAMVPHLHVRVARMNDLRAAMVLRRLTGDVQPVLDTLHTALAQDKDLMFTPASCLAALGTLGDALHPLLPAARRHLTGTAGDTLPRQETQILAARIAAAVDGPHRVLPTVVAVLGGRHQTARTAALNLIADLAHTQPDHVGHLQADVRAHLTTRGNRIAAARALARLGVPTADLALSLVQAITDSTDPDAVTTIVELHAVETIPALQELLTDDRRLPLSTSIGGLIWADDQLHQRIHEAIDHLHTPGTGPAPHRPVTPPSRANNHPRAPSSREPPRGS
jgi:hypothetical protein